MTPRIFYTLLIAFVLMILTACGTSTPRRDVELSSDQRTEHGYAEGDYDSREQFFRNAADRGLAEAEELSAGLDYYQPGLILEILRSLESVPSSWLIAMTDLRNHDPEFTEWLELAVQIRSAAISGTSSSIAAGEWAKYHYGHLVSRNNFSELVASYRALFPVPSQVAVLLPAEGRLSAAAKAIRDGIMSAYLDQPGDSVIRFYSSGHSSESAIAAYQQASDDGARQIIGPLHIDSTRAITNLAELTTPVLLLNDKPPGMEGDTERAGIVNSLSLATTEEAAAIAARTLAQGQRDAIIMVPDSGWGKRIEAAFTAAFEQGGGRIIASTRFDTAVNDQSAMLTQLLKIDASKQRKSDLQSWLGVALTFEPTRRYDFDFIFMAANPVEGRELKPLLRFYDAGDVPVYAMGRIFSGRMESASNQDLNGIVFPTTRRQLQAAGNTTATPESIAPANPDLASVRGGAYGNLYALGQDAWRLLPWLPLMRKDPDLWFPGEVGSLRLQVDGSLYREPAWAQFSAGRPTAFQWQPVDGT
ncbi:MAG: hypothetical protein BMS9Abin30_1311 [Gammaproteobacteria bacterium]|nr:MAG: hypothetical protein BMS9Abin30_1311 [Gammaproteobacteria bacterium]